MKAARMIAGHVLIANLLTSPFLIAMAAWNGVEAAALLFAIWNLIHITFAVGMAHGKGLL